MLWSSFKHAAKRKVHWSFVEVEHVCLKAGRPSQPENQCQIHPAGTLKRSHRDNFCCLHCGFGLQVVQVAIHSCYGQDAPAAAVL
jgi:hypothetical protein